MVIIIMFILMFILILVLMAESLPPLAQVLRGNDQHQR